MEVTPPGASVIEVDSTNFEQIVLQGSKERVIVVDFWAEWCGPCKTIAPILEEIATEQSNSIRIAKVNVDEAPDLARRFEVMSIPTLILFADGQPTTRIVGAKGKPQLLEELAPHL